MKSHLTKDFRVCFAGLPERIQHLARDNYRLWKGNTYHPSLAFKRVGKKYPTYAVRIGLGWRALCFKDNDNVVWFWIGSHAIYDRLIKDL